MSKNDYGQDFNQNTFTPAIKKDLQNAKGRVVIHSPYVGVRRTQEFEPILEDCVNRGVSVHVIAQLPMPFLAQPKQHNKDQYDELVKRNAIVEQILRRIGVHLRFVPNIHEKFAVIDRDILWTGSENILGYSNHTTERMTRIRSRAKVRDIIEEYRLDHCLECKNKFITEELPEGLLKKLGADVRSEREKRGLSQREMAKLCKQSQCNTSKIENGTQRAKVWTLAQICLILDCTIRMIPSYLDSRVDRLLVDDPPDEIAIQTCGSSHSLPTGGMSRSQPVNMG